MAKFTRRDKLRARMKAIPVNVRKALRAQNKTNAAEMVATARRFVRKDDYDLHNSIRHQDVSDSTRISQRVAAGGRKAVHGWWVEVGTSKMAAYPYFWPTWRMLRRRFKARMTRAAKKAIRDSLP